LPPRWSGADPWKAEDNDQKFTHEGGSDVDWLRYRNLVPSEDRKSVKAALITDVMGYNSGQPGRGPSPAYDWASDLMFEADITADGSGELWLELSRGVDRFQARFNLSSGDCTLVRLQGKLWVDGKKPALRDVKETTLETKPTKLKSGTHHVRFANYDNRLTLWVDDDLPFGPGKEYDPAPQGGPTEENDLERPAGIGAKGTKVQVEHLKVWRDTYYTVDYHGGSDVDGMSAESWSDPASWDKLRNLDKFKTLHLQPGHYLCMGDNSTQSSDGRDWGAVPDRLMLGRALIVYYPFKWTYTWPHNPENRVGAIH
jgi:signal peptidase I